MKRRGEIMSIGLKSKVLGVALAAFLAGGAGVLAQTSAQQPKAPAPQMEKKRAAETNQRGQSCPMMKDARMEMSRMDVSMMTACCKKAGMMNMNGKTE